MIDELFENKFTIECLEKVDSTNTYKKKFLKKENPRRCPRGYANGRNGYKGQVVYIRTGWPVFFQTDFL